jgi:hypothetical protein
LKLKEKIKNFFSSLFSKSNDEPTLNEMEEVDKENEETKELSNEERVTNKSLLYRCP